jgi:hypothetical protein
MTPPPLAGEGISLNLRKLSPCTSGSVQLASYEFCTDSAGIVFSLILGPSASDGSGLRGQILSSKDFESA